MPLPVDSLLPVLDLMDGLVVRGVAGQRQQYQSIESEYATSAAPVEVARQLSQHFGFQTFYVADLDAIQQQGDHVTHVRALLDAGFHLVLDAGLDSVQQQKQLFDRMPPQAADRVDWVVGLESLETMDALSDFAVQLEPPRWVFSLDLLGGVPKSGNELLKSRAPFDIAEEAIRRGARRLIVLDLAAVGVGGGPATLGLCQQIRAAHPDVELISGGGVRSGQDVRQFLNAGCQSILVASALHDGSLAEFRRSPNSAG